MNKVFRTQDRHCQCCGSSYLEKLWTNESRNTRHSRTWIFTINIVVCKDCGFSFTSPSLHEDDLNEYHLEGFAGCKDIGLPYNIDTRISFLKKYSFPEGSLVEIGGDMPDEFHQKCFGLFKNMTAVEISSDIDSEVKDHGDLGNNSADIVIHYDVLEHVLDVKNFLTKCFNVLKPGGIMICEMPDIHLYPHNLVILEAEHVNHFSVKSLSKICSQVGLHLIEYSDLSSRPHGFTAIFKKDALLSNKNESNFQDHEETSKAIKSINSGVSQVKYLKDEINRVKDKINKCITEESKITIWAVTEVSRMLIDELSESNLIESDFVKVVDIDSRRRDHLFKSNGIYVDEPKNIIKHIQDSSYIIIAAPRYSKNIQSWIKANAENEFMSIDVLATDRNGNPLT